MLFHSWLFVLFFAVVAGGFFALARTRSFWVGWLLAASYLFYAAWSPWYLLLLIYSTLLDYAAVAFMERCRTARGRRAWLAGSLLNNLALLAYFKYADFFIANGNALLERAGLGWRLAEASAWMPFGWEYVLPVGISFYTFQSMSYTIDYYRGRIAREPSFVRFAAFVALFPQLVAGPIERSSHLLPQLYRFPRPRLVNLTDGLSLFLVGLFKKVALADYLAPYVERVYGAPAEHGAPALILATVCFAWQIYFDFSGYTDMARGVARVLGFDLMVNFNHPYLATGLGDFWARWHISLSTWFRDYLYIPLGGNRGSEWMTARNLLLVFVISGFWHGAAWTFLIWGLLHGIGVAATRRLERAAWYAERMPLWARRVWVFAFVCLAWVFFRAENLPQAGLILGRMITGPWTDPRCPLLLLALVAAVWIYQGIYESRFRPVLARGPVRVSLALGMLGWLLLGGAGGGAFIYFQF